MAYFITHASDGKTQLSPIPKNGWEFNTIYMNLIQLIA